MIVNKITSPSNKSEFEKYYYFRWKYLRKGLDQELGSERDNLEDSSFHKMIINNNLERKIIGVGRLHQNSLNTYQVRYFAIHKDFRRRGLGSYLMNSLEKKAIENSKYYEPSELYISLNARENALNFYENLNYKNIKKTNLLFGKIQHYEMRKKII
jgi:GNAT superfamily N-acetyltransferase